MTAANDPDMRAGNLARQGYMPMRIRQQEKCNLEPAMPSRSPTLWRSIAAALVACLIAVAAAWTLIWRQAGQGLLPPALARLQAKAEGLHVRIGGPGHHGGTLSHEEEVIEDMILHLLGGTVKAEAKEAGEAEPSCHTAVEGERCFKGVVWAMCKGIEQQPDWYLGLTRNSSFEQFQALLHEGRHHSCRAPCVNATETAKEHHHGCPVPGTDEVEPREDGAEFTVIGQDSGDEEWSRTPTAAGAATVTTTMPTSELEVTNSTLDGKCSVMEEDFEYPGGNLRAVEGMGTADTCCMFCRAEPKCRQWTHNRSSRTCILKHQLELKREKRKGLTSGCLHHDLPEQLPGQSLKHREPVPALSLLPGYTIESELGICLDSHPRLHAATCDGADEHQIWVYDPGTSEIYSKHGSCLDASLGGEAIEVHPCSTSRTAEGLRWDHNATTGLVRSALGYCISASRHDADSRFQMIPCDERQAGQRWNFREVTGATLEKDGSSAGNASNSAGAAAPVRVQGAGPENRTRAGEEPPAREAPRTSRSGSKAAAEDHSSTTSPPSMEPFKVISKGTCAEADMMTITTEATCRQAAMTLHLPETWARPTSNVDRPEGCYMFEMKMLWMNLNPKSKGQGWMPHRYPICMRRAPLFEPEYYVEQEHAAFPAGGEIKLYGVGSSNLVWMNWFDQVHYYLERLGYKVPVVPFNAILTSDTHRSVPTCDDSAYFAHLKTTRLGMVGWNSWDFAYNNWDLCDDEDFRSIGNHTVKCGVGPGCIGGKFLLTVSSVAEDAAKSDVAIVSTWNNDHKAYLTNYKCFGGEKLRYENTSEITIPTVMRTIKEIRAKSPTVVILVMAVYPPTLNFKVVEKDRAWVGRLNMRVREAVEKEPNVYFVDFDLPGDVEVYDKMHYGHPNCRGAKVMVHATLRRLYEAKVLGRGLRIPDPEENIGNPHCHTLKGAACSTSAICWVDPVDARCKPYGSGHRPPKPR